MAESGQNRTDKAATSARLKKGNHGGEEEEAATDDAVGVRRAARLQVAVPIP